MDYHHFKYITKMKKNYGNVNTVFYMIFNKLKKTL
jgi:hypothetical protein